jgi:osmoprotectant transport system substrate-binding protein
MRTVVRFSAAAAGLAVVAAMAAGCGSKGSSGTAAPTAAGKGGCAPIADSSLVVLTDDKHLQASDNVVPAVNVRANNPALLAALDVVSASLDTPKLVAMNKEVDVDKKTPAQAAADFASQNNVLSGVTQTGPGGKIKIGTADFAENEELAELYKLALTKAGYDVTVQKIGRREIYEPALEKNQIQVVPEYAATLSDFLNAKENGKDAPSKASGQIDQTMAGLTELGTKANLVFGTPSAAADQNAFAVTKALATKYNLTTLSDFAAKCSGEESVLAGPAECPQRPFCQPGLDKTYGIKFGSFKSTDAGGPITKTALTSGQATMGLVFSSDSSLSAS